MVILRQARPVDLRIRNAVNCNLVD